MAASTASQIIEAIGGAGNVKSLTHCATRLRFELVDAGKVDQHRLETMKGVLGAVPQSGDRYQVVIGRAVATMYEHIMHLPELRVNCTCVRVPVLRSHSESITLEFERDITVEEARAALAAAPGVKLVDDMGAEDAHDRFPMPMDTSDQDLIWVGRVRRDISNPEAARGITFWCCGDQIRKGAATNAVQIAKLLCE